MANCPICQKPEQKEYTPFCSKRCTDIDLHRWFQGNYAIPAVELDDIDEQDIEENSQSTH